jgi:hypothetical protein
MRKIIERRILEYGIKRLEEDYNALAAHTEGIQPKLGTKEKLVKNNS